LFEPMGVIGVLWHLFVAYLWLGLCRQPEEWSWLYVFLIFVYGFFVMQASALASTRPSLDQWFRLPEKAPSCEYCEYIARLAKLRR
jgi:hypothetical protein